MEINEIKSSIEPNNDEYLAITDYAKSLTNIRNKYEKEVNLIKNDPNLTPQEKFDRIRQAGLNSIKELADLHP